MIPKCTNVVHKITNIKLSSVEISDIEHQLDHVLIMKSDCLDRKRLVYQITLVSIENAFLQIMFSNVLKV